MLQYHNVILLLVLVEDNMVEPLLWSLLCGWSCVFPIGKSWTPSWLPENESATLLISYVQAKITICCFSWFCMIVNGLFWWFGLLCCAKQHI